MNKQNKTPYTYVCNSVKRILKNLEGKWGNAEISRIPVNVHFFFPFLCPLLMFVVCQQQTCTIVVGKAHYSEQQKLTLAVFSL